MPDTLESARRWSGYVCPDCRFVFRVPRDHDGKGIVCPSCRRMLKIPTAADTPPPLLVPLRRTAPEEPAPKEASNKQKKRRRGRKSETNHSWEKESHLYGRRGGKGQTRIFLIGGGLLLALVVAGITISMNGTAGNAGPLVPAAAMDLTGSAKPGIIDPAVQGDVAFLAKAEPLARAFLAATTVDQVLPLVRHPDLAGPRLRAFYPNGLKAEGLSQFNSEGEVVSSGNFRKVAVVTGEFDPRTLVFFGEVADLKIDWESWVGWSEMSWEDFRSEKPDTGKLFRVILSPVDYYNFDFLDELKWQSYRLVSPDQKHSIYGYVAKDSELAKRLRPSADTKSSDLTLLLKFPKGTASNDQVEIESLVSEDWVEEDKK